MNIHEYQAKELLEKFGVATTRGKVASTPDEAEAIALELGNIDLVVKAQVHAGGRGKGTFKNGFKGGVHVVKSAKEAREVAEKMLGQTLVTHQTGAAGRVVRKVLIAESVEIACEIYFAILLDRAMAAPQVVASTEGGVEIEAVAAETPEMIVREPIDPTAGLQPFQTRKLAKELGFKHSQTKPRRNYSMDCITRSSAAIVQWWRSILSSSLKTAKYSRSMRNLISMTTLFIGIPKSQQCAIPPRKIRAKLKLRSTN